MKIEHHFPTRTPFGIQETFITDAGHIELWGDDRSGYQWRFTGASFAGEASPANVACQYQFPTSDKKTYSNRPDAFEKNAASFVNEN